MKLGIDLGTSRIVICGPTGEILLDEPAVIAVEEASGRVIACGEEAEQMLGRTPPSIIAARPLKKGVIVEYDLAEQMLRVFLRRVCSTRVAKPIAAISISENATEVERRSFIEAVVPAGVRKLTLVPEAMASAIGAGLDVSLPQGQMVVNVGGGTTDVAVITLGGIAASTSIRVGGMDMDEAIIRYVRSAYNLLISERNAELMKRTIGRCMPSDAPESMCAKGRNAISGLPGSVKLDANEICEAVSEVVQTILDAVHHVLEITPPELAGDLFRSGICLTGGAAVMPGLAERIARSTGMDCYVAENPDHCAAAGAARALTEMHSFSKVYDLGDYVHHLSDSITN